MEKVDALISQIKSNYTNSDYVGITGDRYMREVPDSIYKLWYSDGSHSLAYCNLDYYRNRCIAKEISINSFYEDLIDLRDRFSYEFSLLPEKTTYEEPIHIKPPRFYRIRRFFGMT